MSTSFEDKYSGHFEVSTSSKDGYADQLRLSLPPESGYPYQLGMSTSSEGRYPDQFRRGVRGWRALRSIILRHGSRYHDHGRESSVLVIRMFTTTGGGSPPIGCPEADIIHLLLLLIGYNHCRTLLQWKKIVDVSKKKSKI